MARFLLCAPPLVGHTNPLVGIAGELERRGHETAWVGRRSVLDRLLPEDARVFALSEGDPWLVGAGDVDTHVSGVALLKTHVEQRYVPFARELMPAVDDALAAFPADAIIADEDAVGAGFAARRRGLPWATVTPTIRPFEMRGPNYLLDAMRAWVAELVTGLEFEARLEPTGRVLSPHLLLIAATQALSGYEEPPTHYRFVGSLSRPTRAQETPFPWDELQQDRRRVYVSFGTVTAGFGGSFFRELVEAFAGDDGVQLVFAAPPELVPAAPNVLVRGFVPQIAVLAHMHAVVNHAGWNTVCDALANGLPIVLAPMTADQPDIANALAEAGAAIRVSVRRSKAPQLREAVLAVLEEPKYRQAARRLGDDLEAAGGPPVAADELERLLER